MQYNGINLCDFCFEPLDGNNVCHNCGLTHETYHAEAGLLMPGTNLLGKYIIGRVLGRGGFGATYLAYSSDRDEIVAIKEYFPIGIANRNKGEEKVSIVSDDKRETFNNGAKRLYEEANIIARFNTNKNVVSVYEIFYANDTVYYSMEFLKGIDLKGYIKKKGGRLTESEAATVMKGICDALVAVHSTQTLHRDISPDNVFISTNGDIKLIDFGAAKQIIGSGQQKYSVVLKQGFAPVEQYTTNGNQGVWTDIYAVGATIYYAVTGEIPPDAMSRLENEEITFNPKLNISEGFQNVLISCLRFKAEDRCQSAIELLGALERLRIPLAPIGSEQYVQTVRKDGSYTGVTGMSKQFEADTKPGVMASISMSMEQANPQTEKEKAPKVKEKKVREKTDKPKPEPKAEKDKPKAKQNNKLIIIIAAAVALLIIIAVSIVFFANAGSKQEETEKENTDTVTAYKEAYNVKVSLNGTNVSLDYPLIEISDIYVISEKDLFEMFGATSVREGDTLVVTHNEKTYYLDTKGLSIKEGETEIGTFVEAPVKNNKNITMLPLRQMAELFGASVSFNEAESTVELSTEFAEEKQEEPKNEGNNKPKTPTKTKKKCSVCGSTAHTSHPKCPTCGSTDHTTHPKPKCAVCGSEDHVTHPNESSSKPQCPVCGSTAHTSHPKCSVCGSTSHTSHPKCSVCGSTSHTSHPKCPTCGSTSHTLCTPVE